MSKIKKLSGAAVGALLLCTGLVLALLPGAAGAAPARVDGPESFVLSGIEDNAPVTASGLFSGSGRDHGGVMRDILHLSPGRLTIVHPDSESQFTYKINQKTCEFHYTVTGTYTLDNGTGRLTGVQGHGTYIARGTDYLARNADGSCSMKEEPTEGSFIVRAHGPASLPAG